MANVSGPSGTTRQGNVTGAPGVDRPRTDLTETTPVDTKTWTPTAQAKTVDPTIPAHVPNAADVAATAPNPIRTAMQANIDTLNGAVERALGHDAMSLARGQRPYRNGDPITDAQRSALQDATTTFFKETPIAAFAPGLVEDLTKTLARRGLSMPNGPMTRLGDLDDIGRSLARNYAEQFRDESPAAFYGLVASAALSIGYEGGSEKLRALGIKPDLKKSFFDGKLKLRLAPQFAPRFRDPSVDLSATYAHQINDNWRLSGTIHANHSGLTSAAMQATYTTLSTAAAFGVTADHDGLLAARAAVSYSPHPNFNLSGFVDQNFRTGRTQAGAEAAWKLDRNIDFAISGTHDSQGDSRIGAGLRIRW